MALESVFHCHKWPTEADAVSTTQINWTAWPFLQTIGIPPKWYFHLVKGIILLCEGACICQWTQSYAGSTLPAGSDDAREASRKLPEKHSKFYVRSLQYATKKLQWTYTDWQWALCKGSSCYFLQDQNQTASKHQCCYKFTHLVLAAYWLLHSLHHLLIPAVRNDI